MNTFTRIATSMFSGGLTVAAVFAYVQLAAFLIIVGLILIALIA